MSTNANRFTTRLLVVIVNYFSADLVEELVAQLNKQKLPENVCLSIVCVDNSTSKDQAAVLERIQENSSIEIKLKISTHNAGFGNAINTGLKDEEFDFLCCINPDVSLFSDTLSTLLTHAQHHLDEGIWGGCTVDKMLTPDYRHAWQEPSLKNTFAWALGLKDWLRKPHWKDNYQHLHESQLHVYSVDCVSGCCFLISASAWQATGGFDADFFLYSEEVDLCRRARTLGYQPTVVTEAKLIHTAHSIDQSIKRVAIIYSSKLHYSHKHHGFYYNFVYRLLICIGALVRTIKSLFSGRLSSTKVWGGLALSSLFYSRHNTQHKSK